MKRFSKQSVVLALVGAVVGGWAGISNAGDASAEPTQKELMQQLQAMQAKLDAQEARQRELVKRLDTQAAEQVQIQQRQVDADVAAVRSDAQKHSQLFDLEGFTAGYTGGKFVIQSNDGSFSWHPWIHFQFREITNWRVDGGSFKHDDTENGFEVRRARIGFDGTLFSPDFSYFFNWATYRANTSQTVKVGTSSASITNAIGGLPVLEEAWVRYQLHGTNYYIRAGQMHDPLAHEEIVGSKYEVTPERSLQNDIFSNTDAFTPAVTLIYDPKTNYRAEGGINHGIRGGGTNFQDYPNNGNVYDWGVAARAEYKFMGSWAEYNQITAYGNKSDLMVGGFGFDYSEGGKDATLTHAIDLQYGSASGLFLYGSYIGRYTRHNLGIPSGGPVGTSIGTPGVSGQSTYEPSLLLMASYALNAHWEPFLRYEYMDLKGTAAGSQNNVQEISAGTCYWFHGHNAKLSVQVMYLPNGIPIADTSADVLANNKHGELVFTTQFQLLL